MSGAEDDDAEAQRQIDAEDERMAQLVMERLEDGSIELEPLGDELLAAVRPLLKQLAKRIASMVTDELLGDGVCSFSFHRSVPEWRKDGTCQCCGEPRDEHEQVMLCRGRNFGADRVRHSLEQHEREEKERDE